MPLTWTCHNKTQCARVLLQAAPHLPHRDRQFALQVNQRLDESLSAFSTPSMHEVEWIDRLLVAGYELGARP